MVNIEDPTSVFIFKQLDEVWLLRDLNRQGDDASLRLQKTESSELRLVDIACENADFIARLFRYSKLDLLPLSMTMSSCTICNWALRT